MKTNQAKALALKNSSQSRLVQRWREGVFDAVQDNLAEEKAVAIVYNGISHAVMMASPQDLEDFAIGFSFCEGVISRHADIYGIEVTYLSNGISIDIELASEQFALLKQRRRTLVGNTGCGICGKESLAQLYGDIATVNNDTAISHEAIQCGLMQMPQWQSLQSETGAVHAAAWCDPSGKVVLLREDVGRHNALDKLIGCLLRQENTNEGFVIISSRASYEMVQKAARANIGVLAAVSAATTLAVDFAELSGLTLVGFGRPDKHVVYTHPQRLTQGGTHV